MPIVPIWTPPVADPRERPLWIDSMWNVWLNGVYGEVVSGYEPSGYSRYGLAVTFEL